MRKLLLIILCLFISGCSKEIITGLGGNAVIDGNTVYINDSNVYISANPYTIRSSGMVDFKFSSKNYTGLVDFMFGFNTNKTQPVSAELYNPMNISRVESYQCLYNITYNVSSKTAVCYRTFFKIDNISNSTRYNETLFNHSYLSGNLSSKTIYWNESEIVYWKDITNKFVKVNYDYEGMNTWYVLKDINIKAGKEYAMRSNIETKIGLTKNNGKYWVVVKPSSETINQSITNGHIYSLDPWWNTTYSYKRLINCSLLSSDTPIVVNGTYGFTQGGVKQIIWTTCTGPNVSIYYNNVVGEYSIANDTAQVPFEVAMGNGTSYSPTSVWGNNAAGIYHMDSLNDSSSKKNNLSNTGAVLAAGIIGNGYDFESGESDHMESLGNSIITADFNRTVIYWMKMESNSGDPGQVCLGTYDGTNKAFVTAGAGGNSLRIYSYNGMNSIIISNPVAGSWYQVMITYDYIGDIGKTYVNGTSTANTTTVTLATPAAPVKFASLCLLGGTYMDGVLDEVWFFNNTVKSESWNDELYENHRATKGYGELLAEESAPSAATFYTASLAVSYRNISSYGGITDMRHFVYKNGYAYIGGNGADTITILDVSNPATITFAGGTDANSAAPFSLDGARGVDIDDRGLLYVCAYNDDTITVLNVSNPASITNVSNYTESDNPGSVDGCWDVKVEHRGDQYYLYVMSITDDTLTVLNVTDTTRTPIYMTNYSSSALPCSIDDPRDIELDTARQLLFTTSNADSTISIFNISDLTGPIPCINNYTKTTTPYPTYLINGIYLDNDTKLLYVPHRYNGTTILNTSIPESMSAVGEYYNSTPGPCSIQEPTDVWVERGVAYVSQYGNTTLSTTTAGVTALNITVPSNPVCIGRFNQSNSSMNAYLNLPRQIIMNGQYGYLVSSGDSSFYLMNWSISMPLIPVDSCTYDSGNWVINCTHHCNLTSTNVTLNNVTLTSDTANECCTTGFKNIVGYTSVIINNCYVYG